MATNEDVIVFLCPNGHRLNGPASLAGKRGQCPHCKAKFLVPSPDDPSEEDVEEVSTVEAAPDSNLNRLKSAPPASGPSFNFKFEEQGQPEATAFSPPPPPQVAANHPLMEAFVRLMEEATEGSVLELHLIGGGTLVPERFCWQLSHGNCGVFGLPDADGTYTVTAVNWEQVARVTLRHLPAAPEKLFE